MPTSEAPVTATFSFYHKHRIPILLCLASLWCVLLLGGRMATAGNGQYSFMVWNLFLAAIPLVWSRLLSADQPLWKFCACAGLWLLFFPNAPYVVTDLVHLHRKSHAAIPAWYDVGMLANFACLAFIFGLISLRQVHTALDKRCGQPTAASLVVASCFLAGFGIYLGRFLRWNSWDIITRPFQLAADIFDRFIDPFAHPRTWTVTIMFGATILLLHLITRAIVHPDSQARS